MRITDTQPIVAAAEAFRRYRLRTMLSMAGVVLGVAVALVMTAVNDGVRREAMKQVGRLGANALVVRRRAGTPLAARDASSIERLVPFVEAAAPLIRATLPVAGPRQAGALAVVATTAAYARVHDVSVPHGRFLLAGEEGRSPHVCIVGSLAARTLFASDSPIGKSVRVGREWYRVVGVTDSADLDRAIVVPVEGLSGRGLSLDPDQRVDEIWARVADEDRLAGVGIAIPRLLARVHPDRRPPDYDVRIPRQLLDHRTNTQRLFTLMSGTMAVLLLVLGGIGITNTMLTAVLERTREIGLRRAVGATRRDILLQFLAEASAIAVSGGGAGVLVGIAASAAIARVVGWSTEVSASRIVVVLLIATAVGVLSGTYPAMKAAAGAPIDAVTHE